MTAPDYFKNPLFLTGLIRQLKKWCLKKRASFTKVWKDLEIYFFLYILTIISLVQTPISS